MKILTADILNGYFFSFPIIRAIIFLLIIFSFILIINKVFHLHFQWTFKGHKISSLFVYLTIFLISVLISVIFVWKNYSNLYSFNESSNVFSDTPVYVAHALGAIDEVTYTNSLEAFEENYKKGFKIFEVDISLTEDEVPVLWHDWGFDCLSISKNGAPLSHDEFMSAKIYEKYTTLDVEDLILIMKDYPDIKVITDTKIDDDEFSEYVFRYIESAAQKNNCPEVLSRIIPQVYSENMYYTVSKLEIFNDYIFTMYQIWNGDIDEFREHSLFASTHNIKYITMWDTRFNKRVRRYTDALGINILCHTVNSVDEAKSLFEQGVCGIYSDNLAPKNNN